MRQDYTMESIESSEYQELIQFLNGSAHDLFAQTDTDAGIHQMLQRVMEYFHADRAYIFENDLTKSISNNTYEVCAEGVSREIEHLQNIPFEDIQFWIDSFNHDKYINIQNVNALDLSRRAEREILQQQSIHSLIAVPFRRDGVLIGFLGVDNPRERNAHVDRLTSLGDYLSIGLSNRDNLKSIQGENSFLLNIMNFIPGGLGVFQCYEDGRLELIFLNNGYYKMLGVSRELRRRYDGFSVVESLHPDDALAIGKIVSKGVEKRQIADIDIRIKVQDGEYRWVNVKVYFTHKENGQCKSYAFFSDIDQMKRMQLQLKARESAMAMAGSTGDIDFWLYDMNLRMVYTLFHDSAPFGQREIMENIPESMLPLVHGDDILEFLSVYRELEQGKESSECTVRIMRSNLKRYEWRHIRYTRLQDTEETGMAIGFSVSADLEQENRQHFERESQLRQEMIKSAVSYCQINLTQSVVEEYHTNFGIAMNALAPGEPIDESFLSKILSGIAVEDRESVAVVIAGDKLLERYRQGDTTISLEYRTLVQNHRICWVRSEITVTERYYSKDIIAYIFSYDIDVRKKNQLAIEAIMDEEIESVVVIDVCSKMARFAQIKADLESVNPHHEFEYDERYRELIHAVIIKEDQQACEQFFYIDRMVQALETEPVIKLVYRSRNKEGKILRKKVRAFYLDHTKNEIILIRRDITDLYEEEQRQKRALQNAVENANRANKAKSEFFSRMSHDMRTPLNAILSFSSDNFIETASEAQLREYVEKIHSSGEYLLGIINDVLDMSKIEQNKVVLNHAPYAMDDFIGIVDTVIGDTCRKKDITFCMNCDAIRGEWINTDKIRFNQIFMNLLSNAVKFTNTGGEIHLTAEQCNRDGEQRRRYIVSDNGIGMSKKFIPIAFNSFTQEQSNREHTVQGTGLGLSIVKKIVTVMQGTITLESRIGTGTTFTIELPVETVPPPRAFKVEEENISLEGRHILLCEDNEINMEITRLLLEKKGCIMDWACDGKVGCEMFRQSQSYYYDAVLMDIRMPVLDGYGATIEIRKMKRPDAVNIPIIAMTADAFVEDAEASIKVGMNEHLSKPIDADSMYRTIIRCIASRNC